MVVQKSKKGEEGDGGERGRMGEGRTEPFLFRPTEILRTLAASPTIGYATHIPLIRYPYSDLQRTQMQTILHFDQLP